MKKSKKKNVKVNDDELYSRLVKDVAALQAEVDDATQIKEAHVIERNDLRVRINELSDSLETLQAQLSKSKKDLSHLEGILISDDDKIKQTKAKLTTLTVQLDDAKRKRNEEVAVWLQDNYREFDDYSTTDLQNVLRDALDVLRTRALANKKQVSKPISEIEDTFYSDDDDIIKNADMTVDDSVMTLSEEDSTVAKSVESSITTALENYDTKQNDTDIEKSNSSDKHDTLFSRLVSKKKREDSDTIGSDKLESTTDVSVSDYVQGLVKSENDKQMKNTQD